MQYILSFKKVNKDIFSAIRDGIKKVETRANAPRYQKIAAGDTLVFVCGKECFTRRVKRATRFKNTAALLRAYTLREINPFVSSKAELDKMYRSFPGYAQKLRTFGLVAVELKKP